MTVLLGSSAAASALLAPWIAAGVLGPAEVHGASVIARADQRADELVTIAAALALWAPLHGHACVDLGALPTMAAPVIARHAGDDSNSASSTTLMPTLTWPSSSDWIQALGRTSVCRMTERHEQPGPALYDNCPLVLCGELLYTQRQWIDECIVAAELRRRSEATPTTLTPGIEALLDQLLPPEPNGQLSLQRVAAHAALTSSLAVVVGGPGTGKTHTIARLLVAAALGAEPAGRPPRIALAAPTGKAAARLGESVAAALMTLPAALVAGRDWSPDLFRRLSAITPTTIHRLLGAGGPSTRFSHSSDNPLDIDLLVIDEASMVPLPVMARLLEALRPDTRLVLVGDPDQLESIEVGSVLADIVAAADTAGALLASRFVRLTRAHRQEAGSQIGALADAIRLGDATGAVEHLHHAGEAITFIDTGAVQLGTAGTAIVDEAVRNAVLEPLLAAATFATAGDADAALAQLALVRVLCARRTGPTGAQRWNQRIETWVRNGAETSRDLIGRALIATRNDPRQRIANGDTGVLVETPNGRRAAFRTVAGIRWFVPAQLDMIETSYAMTIHKSQGSEYDTVVVVLPPVDSVLIGRELLYTAITRATRRVIVIGSIGAVVACVNTPAQRVTGLAAALR